MTEEEVMGNMQAYEEGKEAQRVAVPRDSNPYTTEDLANVSECQSIREDNWYAGWDREDSR